MGGVKGDTLSIFISRKYEKLELRKCQVLQSAVITPGKKLQKNPIYRILKTCKQFLYELQKAVWRQVKFLMYGVQKLHGLRRIFWGMFKLSPGLYIEYFYAIKFQVSIRH